MGFVMWSLDGWPRWSLRARYRNVRVATRDRVRRSIVLGVTSVEVD